MNFQQKSVATVQAYFDEQSKTMKARFEVTHHFCCQSISNAPGGSAVLVALQQAKLEDLDNASSVIKSWRSRLHLRSLFSPLLLLHVKVFSPPVSQHVLLFKVSWLRRKKQRKRRQRPRLRLNLLQQRLHRPRNLKMLRTFLTKKMKMTSRKAKNLSHERDLSFREFWVSWAGMGFSIHL